MDTEEIFPLITVNTADNADYNIATIMVKVQTKVSKNINPDSTADQYYHL